MGRDWLQKIKLDWHSLHQIQASHNSALTSFSQTSMQEAYENLNKTPCICKPDVQPFYYRPRPVPHTLQAKLDKQHLLQHLESLSIIEPIQFSDWAAPTVAVLKANGELQDFGELAIISLP